MKLKLTILILALMVSGCTFLYDSRGQNSLDLNGAEHAGSKVDNGAFKIGRLIIIKLFK